MGSDRLFVPTTHILYFILFSVSTQLLLPLPRLTKANSVSKSSFFLPLLFPFVCHRRVSAPAVRDADCPSRPEPGTEQVLCQREEMQCELWALVLSSVTDPSPSSNPFSFPSSSFGGCLLFPSRFIAVPDS